MSQFRAAEMIAEKWDVTRDDMEAFALESHRRAAQAQDEGRFDREIVPISVTTESGDEEFSADEGIRPDSSMETLAKLKPAFKEDGVVTAAN